MRVVCDFRTPDENKESPEKWIPGSSVKHLHVPIGTEAGNNAAISMQRLIAGNPTAEQLRARMDQVYREFAIAAAPQYAAVFRQLEQDHLPLLYHCTAGKDRTGVFSALVLLSLGVPEKTVLGDYTLTDKYFADAGNRSKGTPQSIQKTQKELVHLSPEQLHVLMRADPEALKSALEAIDDKYGSFDNYRRQALGVSDSGLQKLRSRLLTP
jgi:protein-tyrosine phosphatase